MKDSVKTRNEMLLLSEEERPPRGGVFWNLLPLRRKKASFMAVQCQNDYIFRPVEMNP